MNFKVSYQMIYNKDEYNKNVKTGGKFKRTLEYVLIFYSVFQRLFEVHFYTFVPIFYVLKTESMHYQDNLPKH